MITTQVNQPANETSTAPQARMRLLEQMAEALDDEAAGLYRRAASFEEEEVLLNREIDARQTEINRLQLKLDALRAERDRLIEKIETLTEEATALRDRALAGETFGVEPSEGDGFTPAERHDEASNALFFRRATPPGPGAA
jgi:predicted RNase H-like nuclease (RuvC/YqgF family)